MKASEESEEKNPCSSSQQNQELQGHRGSGGPEGLSEGAPQCEHHPARSLLTDMAPGASGCLQGLSQDTPATLSTVPLHRGDKK